jgi:hypothetical protein
MVYTNYLEKYVKKKSEKNIYCPGHGHDYLERYYQSNVEWVKKDEKRNCEEDDIVHGWHYYLLQYDDQYCYQYLT